MLTERTEAELPEDRLKTAAKELFEVSLKVLEASDDFKNALAKSYLQNPQGKGYGHDHGHIKFQSGETNFEIKRESDLQTSEMIMLISKSDGVEEHAIITLKYKVIPADPMTHFGGSKRDEDGIDTVNIFYKKINGEKPPEVLINTQKAVEKISWFLHEI